MVIKYVKDINESEDEDLDPTDTNTLILPSKKVKGKKVEEETEEKKKISKRKQRALEAVAKKKARQAERVDIIKSLKEVTISQEHRALLLPSAHVHKSKKETQALELLRQNAGISEKLLVSPGPAIGSSADPQKGEDEKGDKVSGVKRQLVDGEQENESQTNIIKPEPVVPGSNLKTQRRKANKRQRKLEEKETSQIGDTDVSVSESKGAQPGMGGFMPKRETTVETAQPGVGGFMPKRETSAGTAQPGMGGFMPKRETTGTAQPGMGGFMPKRNPPASKDVSMSEEEDSQMNSAEETESEKEPSSPSNAIDKKEVPVSLSDPSTTPVSGTEEVSTGKVMEGEKKEPSASIPGTSSSAGPIKKKECVINYPRNPGPQVTRTDEIQEVRHKLPAMLMEQEIVESVLEHDVIVLSGNTGCGKSTQVPQFLYDAGFTSETRKIAITQPRRVATVAITKRVAQELNDASLVEYQVRFDRSHLGGDREKVRLKFMTDGILLKEVQSDFMLRQYGVIIIDEAHERSINCDILIGLLSRVVTARRQEYEEYKKKLDAGECVADPTMCPLKLIIMSATLRLCDFTQNKKLFACPPPVIDIDAKLYPVSIHFEQKTEDDYVSAAAKKIMDIHTKLPPGTILVFVAGRNEVQLVCNLLQQKIGNTNEKEITDEGDSENEEEMQNDKIDLKKWTKQKERALAPVPTEDTAVPDSAFHLGVDARARGTFQGLESLALDKNYDEVDHEAIRQKRGKMANLDRSVTCQGRFIGGGENSKIKVLPLYAQLPADKQLEVFQTPEEGERVVVIATNVAETSVTIPNVRYVVDTGKEKKRLFSQKTGVSRFDIQWASQASANQRAGRCGRIGPGHCYRLFSSSLFTAQFPEFPRIAILSTPIDAVLLLLGTLGVPDPSNFPWPTNPPPIAIAYANDRLQKLGALEGKNTITTLGRRMSQFPLPPRYAKMLLEAIRCAVQEPQRDILRHAIPMIAALSTSNLRNYQLDVGAMCKERNKKDDVELLMSVVQRFLSEKNPQVENYYGFNFKQLQEAADSATQIWRVLNGDKMNLKGKCNLEEPFVNLKLYPLKSKVLAICKRCILLGLIDQLAIQSHDENEMYRTAGFKARLLKNSNTARYRPRPQIVAYNDVIASEDGLTNFLHGTMITDMYQVARVMTEEQSAYGGEVNPILFKIGPLQTTPAPTYSVEKDIIFGLYRPTYVPLDIELECVEMPLPKEEKVGTRIFAKALVEGLVCPKLIQDKEMKEQLAIWSTVISKQMSAKHALLRKLEELPTLSRRELLKRWKKKKKYLLEEMCMLLHPPEQEKLKKIWPPRGI